MSLWDEPIMKAAFENIIDTAKSQCTTREEFLRKATSADQSLVNRGILEDDPGRPLLRTRQPNRDIERIVPQLNAFEILSLATHLRMESDPDYRAEMLRQVRINIRRSRRTRNRRHS